VEPEDLIRDGSVLAGLIHPDDIERRDASIKQSRETLQPKRQELRYLVNGEVRWYDCMARPERQPDGEIFWNGIILEITERKRAEEKLNQNLRNMTLLREISHLISSNLSLDQVGKSIVDGIAEALDPDLVLILLKENGSLRLLVEGPEDSRFKHDSPPTHLVGECLCGLAVRDGQASYSRDITTDTRCTWEECKKAGLRSFAALPLRSGDQVLGVLGLGSGSPRDFEKEAPLLETLAAEISLGLRNSLLLEEATTRADELAQEITERQRAEEELRKTTETLQTLVQASPAAIIAFDPEGTVTLWNPAAERMLGWSAAEALGHFLPQIPQDKFEEHLTLRQRVLQGELSEFEVRRQRKDGSLVDLYISTAPLRDAQGKVTGIMSVQVDITERKRAEAELVKNLAILNEVGAIAKIGGWEHDLITGEATWTKALYDMVEIESGPPPGPKEHLDYYPPKDRAILTAAYQRAIETGEPFDLELQVQTAKKRLYWARVIGRPVFQDGKCLRLVGTAQDITDRKQAEEELQQEKKFSDDIINSLPGIFYMFDPQGKFSRWNTKFGEITGYSAEYMDKIHPLDFFTETDQELIAKKIQEVIEEGQADAEADLVTKNGVKIPHYFTGLRVELDDKPYILGLGIDITERQRAEEELRKTTETLQALVQASPAAIFAFDSEGTVTLWNPAAERIFGWRAAEAVGQFLPHLPPEKFEEHLELKERVWRGELTEFEARRQRKDGSPVDLIISAAPLRDAKGNITGIMAVNVDITERQRAEEALKESEELHRVILSNISDAVFITEDTGDFTYICPNADNIFGCSEAEIQDLGNIAKLLGESLFDAEELDRLGEIPNIEWDVLDVEDRSHNLLINVKRVSIKGGTVLYTCRDITERKRAEEELKESEQRYQLMFEDSPISLWQADCSEVKAYLEALRDSGVQDIRGYFETHPEALAHCTDIVKILDVNKGTLELYEAESKEELQRGLKHIFTEQSYKFFQEMLIALAEGKTVFEGEDLSQTLKGKKVHNIVKLSVLPGFEQSLSRVLVSIIDITERKRAEEELKESEQRYQVMFHCCPVENT